MVGGRAAARPPASRSSEAPPEDPDGWSSALLLRALPGLGPVRFRRLVDRFGSPAGALAAPLGVFAGVAGEEAAKARADGARIAEARRVAGRCGQIGARVLAYGAPGYPRRLGDLPGPPAVLFVLGRTELLARDCVAVVGSRRATAYGRRTARGLGRALAGLGRCVVSGLALGIDAEAHRGALPGPTVAVLGSGVDVPAPASNAALCERIARAGAVISEYAPGTQAAPGHFPARNRIIAALSADVVVVEASSQSGALITADAALELGREVHAVPGPIDRSTSRGTNQLVADGAGVVLDADLGTAAEASRRAPQEPELRAVLAALPAGPVTLDEISHLAGEPVDSVAAAVTVLDLRGFLAPTRDGRFIRTPGAATGLLREGGPAR